MLPRSVDQSERENTLWGKKAIKEADFKSLYHGRSAFTSWPWWDPVRCNVLDIKHVLMHLVHDLIGLIGNKGQMKMTTKRRLWEFKNTGRLWGAKKNSVTRSLPCLRPPWSGSPKVLDALDEFVHNGLGLPQTNTRSGRYHRIFKHTCHMKIAECTEFVGPLGIYLLSLCEIDREYFDLFKDLITNTAAILTRMPDKKELGPLQEKLNETLGKAVIMLPVHFFTIQRWFMRFFAQATADAPSLNMHHFEQFNQVLVGAGRGQRHPVDAIIRAIVRNDAALRCQQFKKDTPSDPLYTPLYLSTVAVIERMRVVRRSEISPSHVPLVQRLWAQRLGLQQIIETCNDTVIYDRFQLNGVMFRTRRVEKRCMFY